MAKKIIMDVGQTFSIYDDKSNLILKVKCVENIDVYACENCIFHRTFTCSNIECNGVRRPDSIDVHFKYITL